MTPDLLAKLKPIQLLILDVDGTLTDGLIYYGNSGEVLKAFHVHDGLGMHLLKKAGIEIAIITAKQSDAVAHRMKELGLTHVYLGCSDKRPTYNELKSKLNLQDNNIAYVGDDLPDLCLMQQAGVSFTLKNAPSRMHQYADYITQKKSGRGAIREICECILEAQDKLDAVLAPYLS
jgi:3-deoxy-D-manno-octulosonate 8-phosphate phosphatase (KDO 8-P phosphatase)